MNRTIAGLSAALLLPAGTVAVLLMMPNASAEQPPPPAPAPGESDSSLLAAMERDLGLAPKEARERIAREAKSGRSAVTLRKKLGTKFGGAWLKEETGELVVAVTDPQQAAEVQEAGAIAEVVEHSATELENVKDELDDVATKAPADDIAGWYVDSETNEVVVLSTGDAAAAADFIKASGVDPENVRVEVTDEQPETYADLRGGDPFFMGRARCSIGFATEDSSFNPGFVTAGHCGTEKTPVSAKPNGEEQGYIAGSSFPGDDWAWVRTNKEWAAQPFIKGERDATALVTGAVAATVGSTVCRSGDTTGYRCGTVTNIDASINYKQGIVSGLTRTTACSESGDSGGPFVQLQESRRIGDRVVDVVQAQGVTSGGSNSCTNPNPYTYFQPVDEILEKSGDSLVTTRCLDENTFARGTLTQGGNSYHPNGSYVKVESSGTISACLFGPRDADYDLYLQKWDGTAWVTVKSSVGNNADEKLSYAVTVDEKNPAAFWTIRVRSSKGSGKFEVAFSTP